MSVTVLLLRSWSSNMQRLCVTLFSHFKSPSSSSSSHHRLMLFSSHSFANYLVDSLGFSHQQALSTSNRLSQYRKVNHFKFESNANSVITLFRRYGFNDTHLIKIVFVEPRVLCSNVDNTIEPKFKFLLNHGFSGSDLIRVITVNPKLLSSGLESSISPALDILRQVMGCDTLVITLMKRLYRSIFSSLCKNLMPNVDLLTSYGIPIELIRKHLLRQPIPFMQNPEKLKDKVIMVENKMGIPPNSLMFLYGIILLSGFSEETIQSKCRMFKSFGWAQSDVNTLMMKKLNCFALSVASIEKKLDFFMNKIQLKPVNVTSNYSNSTFFTYSLERRIVPRHEVLLMLKRKGLLEKCPSFHHAVKVSEPCFLKRFVIPFKEVHQVYAKRTGCSMKKLAQEVAIMLSNDAFANYLVYSLGFSHQQALSTSTRLYNYRKVNHFSFAATAVSVVTLLKEYGFNDTHLIKIVSFEPRVLCSNAQNTIQPKLIFFQHQGFSESDLIQVLYVNPKLLLASSESSISPALEILRRLLVCDTLVILVFKKLRWREFSSICVNLMPNVDLLTSYGIPVELIRKHFVHKPVAFMQNPKIFKDMVITVENKLAISPDSPMFLYGILLVSGRSVETVETKCRIFKSFGWTQLDVETLMMKNASCFSFSVATIKKKLDFLMGELGLKPTNVASSCFFFTCSLEKRIVPRHEVLVILKEKCLLKKYPSINYAVLMAETCFLTRFVIPFKEVHRVYAKHTGCSIEMLTQEGVDDLPKHNPTG